MNQTHSFLPQRRLPLQGAYNTRDLGGYPCQGGVTRWGVFLRSDCPHSLTEKDIETLRRFGVRSTLDLRGEDEREEYPSLLESTPGFIPLHVSLSDQLLNADYEGDTPGSMAGLYLTLLDYSRPALGQALRLLASAEGCALFHCAVGKDRTGVVSMLLLGLCGVCESDIVADYAVTDTYMRELANHFLRENGGRYAYRVSSLPISMWRTLQHLQEVYGGAENYLRLAGLSEGELNAIREKLVQPL